MRTAILTVTCANYFAKALAMAASVKHQMPGIKCFVCLVEKSLPSELQTTPFDEIILAKDLGIKDFDHFLFSHTAYEACASLKATLFKRLVASGEFDYLIHLDPDILLFSPFVEVFSLLQKNQIIITPHFVKDDPSILNEPVVSVLKCGIYNTGFLAIAVSKESAAFLDWWETRLLYSCYIDFPRGLYVDQRWIDLAASLFEMHVLRHPGYNVATWNAIERPITQRESTYYSDEGPLRFYHFSGVSTGDDLKRLKECNPSGAAEVFRLRRSYLSILKKFHHEIWATQEWSYGRYHSGEEISDTSRSVCRFRRGSSYLNIDPFSKSNGDFEKWQPV